MCVCVVWAQRCVYFFFLQAEDGIRIFCLSRGLGNVYKSQLCGIIYLADGSPRLAYHRMAR